MHCVSCGFANLEGMRFCEECGTKLVPRCPSCDQEVRPTAKFCGHCGASLSLSASSSAHPGVLSSTDALQTEVRTPEHGSADAERRQLTVMFCNLVGSTALAAQLDPEELREVVRAYQQICAGIIDYYEGYIAQYLGDGLLVYFGYPLAHEDDARRSVQAALEIVGARQAVPLQRGELSRSAQVRIGIHTGFVVVGEIGSGDKHGHLALGETPNIAARVQEIAAPNTVLISEATQRLVEGDFECRALDPNESTRVIPSLKVYRILSENLVRNRLDRKGTLPPLVGREEEINLLLNRWEHVQEGRGQVILLHGEPGIGKSRLVQALKERVTGERHLWLEARCSSDYQHSALYPLIDFLQRMLQFQREDTPEQKLQKLESTLALGTRHAGPLPEETLPLLAALLSLPVSRFQLPSLTPRKKKEKTLQAILAWLLAVAERQPVFSVWEDLHWADPSTLELLGLLLSQVQTARLLVVLTFRPDFTPAWDMHSHMAHLTLSRLGRRSVEEMVANVTSGKALPSEVVHHITTKTDGVPLFVEELTKMVLESGLLADVGDHYELKGPLSSLAIPSTLQDSLMARLDRLAPVKEIAQLGAAAGREFSYELIHALVPLEEGILQQGLQQLVERELIYQRGLPPQAIYTFKHALIQETAYQSLLKKKRQQLHQQIGQVLEERFPETKETQPELLAHHYTEAGLVAQAIPYWQQAGQRATQRSANIEAIGHLTKGLELLQTLPDSPERIQQELALQIALGTPLLATKGFAAPDVGNVYTRALELCRQIGETPQLFPVLAGLRAFYTVRGESQTARELGEQLLRLAQSAQAPAFLLEAHYALGISTYLLGEFLAARAHFEQSITLYDSQQHRSHALLYGFDTGVACLSLLSRTLWYLGYPDQALKRTCEAVTLAQKLTHPQSLAFALVFASGVHRSRREGQAAQARAEETIALSREQGFVFWGAEGTFYRGWALAEQGHGEEGVTQVRQGVAGWRATGAKGYGTGILTLLVDACEKVGQVEEGLSVLAEALAGVENMGEHYGEAELYRLKGELMLKQFGVPHSRPLTPNTQHAIPSLQAEAEAEGCFLKAIEIARGQRAKSWELRATVSLARLWQQQGKKDEARHMLADIYNWFTEGFDTKDLQEAKVLLEELT